MSDHSGADMGWEERHNGRRYLYRNQRVDGKPVKTYLGASGRTGLDAVFVNIIEDAFTRLQKHEARCRALTRKIQKKYRDWIDSLFAAVDTANGDLRIIVDGILYSIGFHKHHRGEWRMQISNMKLLKRAEEVEEQIKDLKARLAAMPNPMLNFQAPTTDAEAVEVFAKARAGDLASQEQVRALIVTRGWVGIGRGSRQAGNHQTHPLGSRERSRVEGWDHRKSRSPPEGTPRRGADDPGSPPRPPGGERMDRDLRPGTRTHSPPARESPVERTPGQGPHPGSKTDGSSHW